MALDAFCENDDMPVALLTPLVLARRAELLRSAVAALQRDFQADGRSPAEVAVAVGEPTEYHPMGRISVEGQSACCRVRAYRL